MNFQTSKRIMCCLMAALILCCAVVRPLEAQATSIALGATAVSVSIGEVIGSAIISLGVTAATLGLLQNLGLNTLIVADSMVPDWYDRATSSVECIQFDNKTYVPYDAISFINDALWNKTEYSDASVVQYTWEVYSPFSDHTIGELTSQLRSDNATWVLERMVDAATCYSYYMYKKDDSNVSQLYGVCFVFADEEPTCGLSTIDGNGQFIFKNLSENDVIAFWHEGLTTDEFDVHTGVLGFNIYGIDLYTDEETSAPVLTGVDGYTLSDYFAPTIDTDKNKTWIEETGIWIVLPSEEDSTDSSEPTNDGDNEQEKIPYVPLSLYASIEDAFSKTLEEVRTGENSVSNGTPIDKTVQVETNNSSSGDSGTNDSITDTSNIFELLEQFWQDVKNGFANLIEKVTSIRQSIKTIVTTSNSILEAIKGLADLLIPGFVEAFTEAFTGLFKQLAEWLQPLMDYLLEGLKTLFVPKTGYFDAKITELRAEFKLFDSILATLYDLKGFLLSLGSTPPVIYANLAAAGGSIYWGANTVFVDMSWYAPYKPTMDTILSGLLWLWFAWRMVLSIPGILGGMSGMWKNPTNYTKTTKEE